MYSTLTTDGLTLEQLAQHPVGDAICAKLRKLAEEELGAPDNEAVLRRIVQEAIAKVKTG